MNYSVVHVFGVMDRGGAELRTLDLVDLIPGVNHAFVTLSGRRGVLADTIERAGGSVIPCRLSATFPVHFYLLLRRLKPGTVQSNVATFSGAILALAWLARVPKRVAHFRSDGDEHGNEPRYRLQRSLMRRLIQVFATDVLGNAPQALAFAWSGARSNDPKARVVPDGVASAPRPSDEESGSTSGQLLLVHIARSLPTKRRQRAIEILGAAVASGLDVHMRLVGPATTDERSSLQELADSLEVGKRIAFVGSVSSVSSILCEASLLLVTSAREGLPGVVLEALAHGCPAVSTNLPGVMFIKEHIAGITTISVNASDSAWVEAIQETTSAQHPTRAEIWDSFQHSPFTLDNAADQMRLLWTAGS